MGVSQLGTFTVTLGGQPLTVIPDPTAGQSSDAPGYDGSYQTQDATLTLTRRDVPLHLRRLSKGAGYMRRRDQADDGGYAWCEDATAWTGSGVSPSGRRQRILFPSLTAVASSIAIVGSVEFEGHLWFVTSNNFMIRIPNADPAQTPVMEPQAGVFVGTFGFHANHIGLSAQVFTDPSGNAAMYVTTTSNATGQHRMYKYQSGAWTSGIPFVTQGIEQMGDVWWQGTDGVGAQRLLGMGSKTLRHVIQGQDPLLEASWVTPITIGNGAHTVIKLITGPRHLYVQTKGGLYDVSELRTANLTPYWTESLTANMPRSPQGVGMLHDDHVYMARAYGLDRYPVGVDGYQQRIPGECGPGKFLQDGSPVWGWVSSLTSHDGWLLAAVFNPLTGTSYICRGIDRRKVGEDVPNPLVWHYAEQVITGGHPVFHMNVAGPSSGYNLTSYLWMGLHYDEGGLAHCAIDYAPLPYSGPISLQVSDGTGFSVNPSARIYLTAQDWGDPVATKAVRRYDLVGTTVSATATLELFTRGDGDPTTITNQGTWTSQGVATGGSAALIPAASTVARSIGLQVLLTTPSPYTNPPRFESISPRAKVIRETFDVRRVWVLLERDYELPGGMPDIRDPDETFAAVAALQDLGAQAYVDEQGRSYTVLVEQGIAYRRVQVDDNEWRTAMRLELSLVSGG